MNKDELYLMRRNKKITLKEISENLNCSLSLVSRFERGQRNFTEHTYNQYKEYIINK